MASPQDPHPCPPPLNSPKNWRKLVVAASGGALVGGNLPAIPWGEWVKNAQCSVDNVYVTTWSVIAGLGILIACSGHILRGLSKAVDCSDEVIEKLGRLVAKLLRGDNFKRWGNEAEIKANEAHIRNLHGRQKVTAAALKGFRLRSAAGRASHPLAGATSRTPSGLGKSPVIGVSTWQDLDQERAKMSAPHWGAAIEGQPKILEMENGEIRKVMKARGFELTLGAIQKMRDNPLIIPRPELRPAFCSAFLLPDGHFENNGLLDKECCVWRLQRYHVQGRALVHTYARVEDPEELRKFDVVQLRQFVTSVEKLLKEEGDIA